MDLRLFGVYGCVLIITFDCVSAFLFWGNNGPPEPCDKLNQYTDLLRKFENEPCISDTEVWPLIKPIYEQRDDCFKTLIDALAYNFAKNKALGQECHCTDKFPKVDDGSHHHSWTCNSIVSPDCKYLVEYFFKQHYGGEREFSACKTNHHVWEHLKAVKDNRRLNHHEITDRLVKAYTQGNEYICQCYIYATNEPDTFSTELMSSTPSTSSPSISLSSSTSSSPSSQPITTMEANTTSILSSPLSTESLSSTDQTTTTSTVSTTIETARYCRKYDVIFDVAVERIITNTYAYPCPSGSRASSEAYVLSTCDVSLPEDWEKGPKVMDNCETLHAYTPIASFTESVPGYRDNVGLAAVFIKCVDNGITMAYQKCDSTTEIIDIFAGNETRIYDASRYHLIL
ncbi:hypothetical protein ACF0H5_004248 [Mactra antiquata]